MREQNNLSENDWHRADIIAALRKKGWTLRKLSAANGLAAGTLKTTLDRRWPKGEQIIAKALGIKAKEIWPSRYANPVKRGRPAKEARS